MERVTGIGGFFFRARNPDALRAEGETVEVDPQRYPNGRFAELRDPEGNGIQLWQPMGPA